MSRLPRRSFLAPFILTAAAALPGCKPAAKQTIHENPPAATPYQTWDVWASDDGCQASFGGDDSCPPGASCNPPPPMAVACPEGMTGEQVTIVQDTADGPCQFETGGEVACPEELAPDEPMPPDEEFPPDED